MSYTDKAFEHPLLLIGESIAEDLEHRDTYTSLQILNTLHEITSSFVALDVLDVKPDMEILSTYTQLRNMTTKMLCSIALLCDSEGCLELDTLRFSKYVEERVDEVKNSINVSQYE